MNDFFKKLLALAKTILKGKVTMSDNIPAKKIKEISLNIVRANRIGLQLAKDIPEPFLSNISILSNLLMAMNQVKENFPHIIEKIKQKRIFDAAIRDLKIGLNGFDVILAKKTQNYLAETALPIDIDKIEVALMSAVKEFNKIGRTERDWLTDSNKYCSNVLTILKKCASGNEEESNFIAWLVEQSLRGY